MTIEIKRITLVAAVLIVLVAAGIYCVSCDRGDDAGRIGESDQETVLTFPIDSEDEAVDFANHDHQVVAYIEELSKKGFEVRCWAQFDTSNNVWLVVFYPIGVVDLSYEIRFTANGEIISKHEAEGG